MTTTKTFSTIGGSSISRKRRDPVQWARSKMQWAFLDQLKPGGLELDDISSIRGYPSKRGYLWHLKDFKKNTPGAESLLLSASDTAEFLAMVRTEINVRIDKYEALAQELEKSPHAIAVYLSDLEKNKAKWKKVVVLGKTDHQAQRFIDQTNELIKEYTARLTKLGEQAKPADKPAKK